MKRADECVYAIADGEVFGIGDAASSAAWFVNHPQVTEVVRMPTAILNRILIFDPWPGREAALAMLEQEAANG